MSSRAERRRQARDARRLQLALEARGLTPKFTIFRFDDPDSEHRLAAVVADLDTTLADPKLEYERQVHEAFREQCALSDPTRPAPEAMH